MEGMTDTHWYPEESQPWARTRQDLTAQLPSLVERLQQVDLYAARLASVDPSGVSSLEALAELPFTTKEDLRDGQSEIIPGQPLGRQQAVPTERIEQVISSSGTTGNPVYFGLTADDRRAWTDALGAFYSTAGVRPGAITALATGMPMVAGGVPYGDGIRAAGGALVWFGGQTTPRMVSTIERLQVNTLVGTASFVTYFAGRVEEVLGRSARDLDVRTVIAGDEPGMGLPDVRAAVLDRWGATRLSEVMGLGDVLSGIWAECEGGQGMHFVPVRDVLVELIDPQTGEPQPWAEGSTGEAVYTTVTRQATPVLRFRSRDHLLVLGDDCSCGRRTPRIRCIGRTDDMLIYKAMNVFPSAIREVVLAVASGQVDEIMRLRKDSADQVRFDHPIPLEVQVRGGLDDEAARGLRERIEAAVLDRLRVRVVVELLPMGGIPMAGDKNAMVYVAQPSA